MCTIHHLDVTDGRDAGESRRHLGRSGIVVDSLGPLALVTDNKVAIHIGGRRRRCDDLYFA